MSPSFDDEHPARGDAAGAAEALAAVDALLGHARCAGRAVRYALDGDATPLTREEVEAWLVGAEAEGLTRIRYAVDARGEGGVQVTLSAAEAEDGHAR